jgi:hypothetical protein
MSMLPIMHNFIRLGKILFMQDRAINRGTTVVSRISTAAVLEGHSEVHAGTKSHQGTTRVISAEEDSVWM